MLNATMILSKDYKIIYIPALGEGFCSADTKENPKYSIALHQRAVRSQEFLISPSLLFLLHAYDKVYSLLTIKYPILDDVVLILNMKW